MLKLQGEKVYLATLEKEDCQKLWNDFEYDNENLTKPLNIDHSPTKADDSNRYKTFHCFIFECCHSLTHPLI